MRHPPPPLMTILLMSVSLAAAAAPGCQRDTGGASRTPDSDATQSPVTPPQAAVAIEDITLRLEQIAGRPVEPVPADARAPHIRLSSSDHRVTGFSGVNSMNGTYTLAGPSLRFGPIAMTRRAGPEPLNRQEAAFTRALSDTAAWRAARDRIELLDAAGQPLATFTRAPAAQSP